MSDVESEHGGGEPAGEFHAHKRKAPSRRSAQYGPLPRGCHAAGKPMAFCLRCQAKRGVDGAHRSKTAKGQPLLRGKCCSCGSKVAVMLPRGGAKKVRKPGAKKARKPRAKKEPAIRGKAKLSERCKPVGSRGELAAYCLSCRRKVRMVNPKRGANKKGAPIMRGHCCNCGGGMVKALRK